MTNYPFSFVPQDRLIWVSAYDKETLCRKIIAATYQQGEARMSRHKFNGISTGDGSFQLAQWVSHPNLFLPLLHCKIEPTQSGCLIFVRCSLFFSTQVLVAAGLLFLLAAALYYLTIQKEWIYSVTLLLAMGLFYLTVLGNYHLQKQISLHLLQRVIA
ncbi:MAG: hypothetical protein RMJ87_10290 [Cytophagales bacterium]|nr:hypothetical protein [Bernardetiaceae bacterium]MDW8205408.1 hypothetical protein [Cytophagales bacterium]